MEAVKLFGDPDKLMSEEDLIILKLDKPCPQPLPERLAIDSTGQLLSTNQEGFLNHRKFLGKRRAPAALFAGCSAFDSSARFEKAAELVLKNSYTIVVLHNRNTIFDLYRKSKCLRSLVLLHNLRLHGPETLFSYPLYADPYQLLEIAGTMPGLGVDNLWMSAVTMAQAAFGSPMLTRLQSPMEDLFSSRFLDDLFTTVNFGAALEDLILGARVKLLNGSVRVYSDVTALCIARASRACPNVRNLEVNTTYPESVLQIAEFKKLRRLSITAAFDSCPFQRYILPLLKKFDLEALALTNSESVELSLIANLCPDISSLSLDECTIVDESAFEGFPKLRELRFESTDIKEHLLGLCLLGCRNLESLELDAKNTGAFVAVAPRLGLRKLRRLVLNTYRRLSSFGVGDDALRRLLECLPSLLYLATDSYGIRLFFENNAPQVTLAWTSCTICMADFPKICERQYDSWHSLMASY